MEKQETKTNGHFKREIGLFGGISLVAGMTIGSGIYYLGSYVLERANMSMGMALVCWIVGGIVSILGGLCFAELGASMPVAGGMTTYLGKAYHPAVGFINGFSGFILTCSGSIAALSMACVTAFKDVFSLSDLWVKIIAIIIIVIFTIINLRGVKLASKFQNFTMVARVIPLILIISLGIMMGKQSPNLSLSTVTSGASFSSIISMIAFATFASLWAYEGWTNLNTVAEEMKNPKKHLPLAIIFSLGFITLVYTFFNFAIYRVIPANEVSTMIGSGSIYLGNEVASRLMGNLGHWIVLIGMAIGIIGTVNGDILVFPRTYYAMAKGGFFPKMFTHIDENGVPKEAILASSAMSIILVVLNSLQSLTDLLIFTSAFLNLLAIIAVLVFRKKYPDLERPYKVWGGTITVIITIILFGILLVNEFISSPINSLIGLVIPALGFFAYLYFHKKNGGVEYDGDTMQ